jgi:hypothetical protein
MRKSCAGENLMYLGEELLFILEYYFASKYVVAVCEACSNAYPDKAEPNKNETLTSSGHM